MFYFSKKVRLFSQKGVLFLFYFLINPTMTTVITIAGQGGIGKTTATKYLALNWAEGSSEGLEKFDFVFHITLKDVTSKKQTITEIIIGQHGFLSGNDVQSTRNQNYHKGAYKPYHSIYH